MRILYHHLLLIGDPINAIKPDIDKHEFVNKIGTDEDWDESIVDGLADEWWPSP